jgi:hypothetical protein
LDTLDLLELPVLSFQMRWFDGPDERAHEFAVHLWGNSVHVNAFG